MTLVPVICYRCSECNRLYEESPISCVCERTIYIEGERFGVFLILKNLGEGMLRTKCLLCGNMHNVSYTNIRRQQSCGCKPRSADILELTNEIVVYRCKKCKKTTTKKLPIVTYCCEEEE